MKTCFTHHLHIFRLITATAVKTVLTSQPSCHIPIRRPTHIEWLTDWKWKQRHIKNSHLTARKAKPASWLDHVFWAHIYKLHTTSFTDFPYVSIALYCITANIQLWNSFAINDFFSVHESCLQQVIYTSDLESVEQKSSDAVLYSNHSLRVISHVVLTIRSLLSSWQIFFLTTVPPSNQPIWPII